MALSNGYSPEDDVDDIDYSHIEEKYQTTFDEGFDDVLIIDNLPIVDELKREKMLERLESVFRKQGVTIEKSMINLAWDDEAAKSKGFGFLVFPSPALASHALSTTPTLQFGKNTLLLNRFTDVERSSSFPTNFTAPSMPPFAAKAHLKSWLADPKGRDQYVLLRGTQANVYWNSRLGVGEEIPHSDQRWGDYYLTWSSAGTYLTSLHGPGVALWGGSSFQLLDRYSHRNAALVDFSPKENYIVTASTSDHPISVPDNAPLGPKNFDKEDEGRHIAVWDVKTGRLLRTFEGDFSTLDRETNTFHNAGHSSGRPVAPRWPALKFSPDDKYCARLSPGQSISVYSLPTMELVDKKSIKVPGVMDFEWSPSGFKTSGGPGQGENGFVFWTPEEKETQRTAKVRLMTFPGRVEGRAKNLVNVSDCRLYWQNRGDFLCVKVDRHTKTKKSMFCNLELFRMREKDVPVEVIELKDTVTAFAWEPNGSRFAIVSTSDPNIGNPGPGITIKYNVVFYQLDVKKGDFKVLKTLENKTANRLFWSPKGRHIALATFESSQKCDIEFWDLDFGAPEDSTKRTVDGAGDYVQMLGAGEHYGMTDIAWDPSGRYLTSHATSWRPGTDAGYTMWDFKGQELKRDNIDGFKQFLWRPRPATLLPLEDQKKVRKGLREYSRVFDEEDAIAESQGSAEVLQLRKRLVEEWNAWQASARAWLKDERRKHGVKEVASTEKTEQKEVEEWIEEVLEETEEVVV